MRVNEWFYYQSILDTNFPRFFFKHIHIIYSNNFTLFLFLPVACDNGKTVKNSIVDFAIVDKTIEWERIVLVEQRGVGVKKEDNFQMKKQWKCFTSSATFHFCKPKWAHFLALSFYSSSIVRLISCTKSSL